MTSALDAHPPGSLTFHLLHTGSILDDDVQRLQRLVDDRSGVLFVHEEPADVVAELPSLDRFGRTIWLRFLLPDLLHSLDRVLYLDADTFVTGPLDDLWATDLGNRPIAAVANVVEPAMHAHVRSLGIDEPARFFNSGVLLMDLVALRREGLWKCLVELLGSGQRLVWPDQDALNVLFAERWLNLHPRWNAMNSLFSWPDWAREVYGDKAFVEARTAPAIVHFEGPTLCKPWHLLCPHPRRDDYRRTLARTPWADQPIEGRTVGTTFISLLPKKWWTPAFLRLNRMRAAMGTLTRHT